MFYTALASKKCMELCDAAFGKTHHLNNRENAIRHGLWNILIIKRLTTAKIQLDKAVAWSKTITDWHERFAVNASLECAMDLHNNAIGRMVYSQVSELTELDILNYLKDKAQQAICVSSIKEINPNVVEFVFINE